MIGPMLARLCAAAAIAVASGCQGPLDRRGESPTFSGDGGGGTPLRSGRPSPANPKEAGAPDLGDEATLTEYLAYAAANSPALRAAFHRWRAAVERSPQATALPDPMVGYGYYLEEFTAREAMEQHVFELSQMFPWFGKLRLRGEAADREADIAAHEYEAVRLALFLDVRRAYYELYRLRRETELMEANLELLKQFEAIARARFRVGTATHADVVRAQVEMGRMEDQVRQLEQMRRPAAARLNAALGRAADAPVAWPAEIRDERLAAAPGELDEVLALASPRLRALGSEVERMEVESRLARREPYPDVTLGAMYMLESEDPVLARIAITLPIWPEKYKAMAREANWRRIAAAHMRHDERNRLGAELAEAVFEHDDAQRRIDLYRATLVPKGRESLQASLAGFQGGTTSFLELLDAERTLLEFELAETRARADRAIALARLDALVGSPVARTGDRPDEATMEQER